MDDDDYEDYDDYDDEDNHDEDNLTLLTVLNLHPRKMMTMIQLYPVICLSICCCICIPVSNLSGLSIYWHDWTVSESYAKEEVMHDALGCNQFTREKIAMNVIRKLKS